MGWMKDDGSARIYQKDPQIEEMWRKVLEVQRKEAKKIQDRHPGWTLEKKEIEVFPGTVPLKIAFFSSPSSDEEIVFNADRDPISEVWKDFEDLLKAPRSLVLGNIELINLEVLPIEFYSPLQKKRVLVPPSGRVKAGEPKPGTYYLVVKEKTEKTFRDRNDIIFCNRVNRSCYLIESTEFEL